MLFMLWHAFLFTDPVPLDADPLSHQATLVVLIPFPYLGSMISLVCMSILYALYSFEYKWFNTGEDKTDRDEVGEESLTSHCICMTAQAGTHRAGCTSSKTTGHTFSDSVFHSHS